MVVKLVIHSARFSRFFQAKSRQKTIFQRKIKSDFRSLAYRKQVADVPLQIFTRVYKMQNTLSYNKMLSCKKSTAVHFFFFLRAWHSLKQFYEDFSVAATEEQYIT